MAHPGIFALLVGVAIGTAIYYYLNSEPQQTYQYGRDGRNQSSDDYYPRNSICTVSDYARRSRRRRRKNSTDACVICFEQIPVNLMHTLDSCGHEFHSQCIAKWLRESKVCPICRTAVL